MAQFFMSHSVNTYMHTDETVHPNQQCAACTFTGTSWRHVV